MQVSVRSYLTAGTVTVVGTGAIALAPPVPVAVPALAPPAVAEVTLTGLNLSLDQIVGVLGKIGLGDVISPIVNLLPQNLLNAFVAEFSDQALRLLAVAARGILRDVSSVVLGLVAGSDSVIRTVGTAIAGIPRALIDAVKTLGSDGLAATVQEVVAGVAAPLTGVAQLITDAAKAIRVDVQQRIGDLVVAIPDLLLNVVQNVITEDFQAAVDLVQTAIAGISNLLDRFMPSASVPAGAALAPAAAVRASAVAALPSAAVTAVAEVPQSASVAPRAASRAVQVPLRAHARSGSPKAAAATAAQVATGGSANSVSPRAVAPETADGPNPTTASQSRAAPHSRAAGRPGKAAGGSATAE